MWRRSLFLVALCAVHSSFSLGCAKSAEERHMDKMREELARVSSDHDRFDQRVSALEVKEADSSRGPLGRPTNIEKSKAPETPKLRVVRIGPDGTEEQRGGSEAAGVLVESRDEHAPVKTSAADPEAKRAYDAAIALVNAKEYDRALESLNGFLFRYPDHPRAENALYWRGECFFAKIPDTLLRLGMASEKLGNNQQSEQFFERLRRDYPRSEAARRMKSSSQKREVSP
jgi:TolA-binding protein